MPPIKDEPTHYERLGVPPTAWPKAIKTAYRKLALKCHPDRFPGKEAEFQAIQLAYETLIHPQLRIMYDRHLAEEGIAPLPVQDYFLDEADIKADYYTYYNQLYRLEGDEQIHPGVPMDKRYIEEQLWTLAETLHRKQLEMYAECPYNKMNKEQKKQLTFVHNHERKILLIRDILCDFLSNHDRYKELYDLSLGAYHAPKFRQIEEQLGGRAELIKAIDADQEMRFTNGVFALYEANCLTPDNFQKLRKKRSDDLSIITEKLVAIGCLTQANFDLAYQKLNALHRINTGMYSLEQVGLASERYFHYMVQAGEQAHTVAKTIAALKSADILNQETLDMALKRKLTPEIGPLLIEMKEVDALTADNLEIFRWEGPQEIRQLIYQLHQMFNYGLFLLTRDPFKGTVAMIHAISLKGLLKEFRELPEEEQVELSAKFQQAFKEGLHFHDHIMSEHREYWKVIIANILIALTGIGLFAIGANYAINGQCFFAQTKRAKLIEDIECSMQVCAI